MYESVQQNFFAFSTQLEGRVPYMYVDLKNLVTIGIGNLIDPESAALAVSGFVFKSNQPTPGAAAGSSDIDQDWNAVKNAALADPTFAQKGHTACDPLTKLMLPDPAIDTLVSNKAASNETSLRQQFTDYDSWPADAQLGLLSMAWAQGSNFAGWPAFRAAAASHDWTTAAAQCHLSGVNLDPRNAANRALFLTAARIVSQGGDLTTLVYIPSGERTTIKIGSTGDDVNFLQSRLTTLQYFSGSVDGNFASDTDAAVRAFQTAQQLTADGIVGPTTWAALGTGVPAGS